MSIPLNAQFPVENPTEACSAPHLKALADVDGYHFRSYENLKAGTVCVEIIRGGHVLFRRTNDNDGMYELGQAADKNSNIPFIPNGTDVTGSGLPGMTIKSWSGGAHCCLSDYVFRLEPKFTLVATLDSEDDDGAHFENLDATGHYYYRSTDWTFAYWPSSFAGSPAAPIVLRFISDAHGGAYHLALDKMKQPEPTPDKWAKQVQEARQTLADDGLEQDSGATIWNPVMNLMYGGRSDLAWKFLKEAWPAKDTRKNEWIGDFCSILKVSPYWNDLQPNLSNAPAACLKAKPDEAYRRSR